MTENPRGVPGLYRLMKTPLNMRLRTLILVGAVVIAGCHTTPKPAPDMVTAESVLTVTTPFTVPAGSSGVYFQNNQMQNRADLAADLPYCHFALADPPSRAQTVGPQTFMVTTIEYDEDAAAHGGFSSITRVNLRNGKLAKPPRLSCRVPGTAGSRRFVTPAEINGAMDAYFDLKVAQ